MPGGNGPGAQPFNSDAALQDGSSTSDAGFADGGGFPDAQTAIDLGFAPDFGFRDANGPVDVGFPPPFDAGFADAGFPDRGFPDLGFPADSGPRPDGGITGNVQASVVSNSSMLLFDNSATAPPDAFSYSTTIELNNTSGTNELITVTQGTLDIFMALGMQTFSFSPGNAVSTPGRLNVALSKVPGSGTPPLAGGISSVLCLLPLPVIVSIDLSNGQQLVDTVSITCTN